MTKNETNEVLISHVSNFQANFQQKIKHVLGRFVGNNKFKHFVQINFYKMGDCQFCALFSLSKFKNCSNKFFNKFVSYLVGIFQDFKT